MLNVNIDDCAKACLDELGFDCQSFDFCYLHGDCRLSKTVEYENMYMFIDSYECDVYKSEDKNANKHFSY